MAAATRVLRSVARRWAAPVISARLLLYVLAAVAFVALCSLYNNAALREGFGNPDNVSFVLEAQELLQGNWNLHGWTIVNSAWWPVQPAVYAGVLLVVGSLRTPSYVAALAWATTVACAVWATARPFRGSTAFVAGTVAFLLVGLPAVDTIASALPYITSIPFEALTTAGGLLSLVLFWSAVSQRPIGAARGLLRAGLLAGAAVIIAGSVVTSDALALATVIIPVLALAVFALFRDGWDKRIAAGAVFAIFAFGLSRFLFWLLSATGGETLLQPVNWITFAPFDVLFSRNLPFAFQGLVSFYGAYWFGRPVLDQDTLSVLVHLAALLFVLWAVGRALLAAGAGRKQDWLTAVLALGFVSNVGAYAASLLPADIGSNRYLLAVLPYGGVVAARAFGETFRDAGTRKKLALCGAVLVLAAASLSSFSLWFQGPPAVSPRPYLIKWLLDHNLRYGYAQYSDAAALTVESDGRLVVRPVGATGDRLGTIPYSARHWYAEPMTFVIFHDEAATGVSVAAAERTFGDDHSLHHIGPYLVAVWPHTIHVVGPEATPPAVPANPEKARQTQQDLAERHFLETLVQANPAKAKQADPLVDAVKRYYSKANCYPEMAQGGAGMPTGLKSFLGKVPWPSGFIYETDTRAMAWQPGEGTVYNVDIYYPGATQAWNGPGSGRVYIVYNRPVKTCLAAQQPAPPPVTQPQTAPQAAEPQTSPPTVQANPKKALRAQWLGAAVKAYYAQSGCYPEMAPGGTGMPGALKRFLHDPWPSGYVYETNSGAMGWQTGTGTVYYVDIYYPGATQAWNGPGSGRVYIVYNRPVKTC